MKPKRKDYGWDQLTCAYFGATCRYVLNSYLEQYGFTDGGQDRGGRIYYRQSDVFLNVSYDVENYPKYRPSVVLGIGEDLYGQKGLAFNGVPFWYLIPSDLPERKYSFWTFSSTEDLKLVLARIKDEILEPYAKPLWESRANLEKHISNFKAEFH